MAVFESMISTYALWIKAESKGLLNSKCLFNLSCSGSDLGFYPALVTYCSRGLESKVVSQVK